MSALFLHLQDPALQLVVLVFAIHLIDAARLLFADEGLLLHSGFGWRAMTGSDAWRIAGRRLVFPVLLRPAVVVRMAWSGAATDATPVTTLVARSQAMAPLLPAGYEMAALLFVGLPVVWAGRLGDGLLAAMLGLVYATAICLAVQLVIVRGALGLSMRQALGCGFECLLCPPLSVTLTARLSRRWPGQGDLLATAAAVLPARSWRALQDRVARQRADEGDSEAPDSETPDSGAGRRDAIAVSLHPERPLS